MQTIREFFQWLEEDETGLMPCTIMVIVIVFTLGAAYGLAKSSGFL
jgi:hypothetical protein